MFDNFSSSSVVSLFCKFTCCAFATTCYYKTVLISDIFRKSQMVESCNIKAFLSFGSFKAYNWIIEMTKENTNMWWKIPLCGPKEGPCRAFVIPTGTVKNSSVFAKKNIKSHHLGPYR